MFGWELPPYNSGGLGTACLGLTQGLASLGVEVDFVLPKAFNSLPYNHMRILSAADYGLPPSLKEAIFSLPYGNYLVPTNEGAQVHFDNNQLPPQFQTHWYAQKASQIAQEQQFDVIHCHDWMTYEGGLAAQKVAQTQGKSVPLVAHVHATEMDRAGEKGNPVIKAIEKAAFTQAERVVAVSNYTKESLHYHYQVPLNKIDVVHNGINLTPPPHYRVSQLKKHHKLVLFMGRITQQKGPDYFLRLAKKVTDQDPSVKFLMVGSGDLEQHCIEEAARQGLSGKVLFSSFLRGPDVQRAYQMADLFVMPSVSEPFGIVALEAIQNGTPVLACKQSGVAEVCPSLMQADFWDTEAMARQLLKVLHNPTYAQRLCRKATREAKNISWQQAASKLYTLYQQLLPSSLSSYA